MRLLNVQSRLETGPFFSVLILVVEETKIPRIADDPCIEEILTILEVASSQSRNLLKNDLNELLCFAVCLALFTYELHRRLSESVASSKVSAMYVCPSLTLLEVFDCLAIVCIFSSVQGL